MKIHTAYCAALWTVATLAALLAVFLYGVPVPAAWLRAPLERVLTATFGAPTRIEGALRVTTGRVARASADALVIADPLDASAPPLARGTAVSAQIDLGALLGSVVRLREIAGDRIELRLARAPDGRANWAPLFPPSPGGSSFSFAGIDRLRIGMVDGAYHAPGREPPFRFAVAALDSALGAHAPVTARGTADVAAHAIEFDLRTVPLADLIGATTSVPLQLALAAQGARLEFDGAYTLSPAVLDGPLTLSAANADTPLAAVGVAARDAGQLAARGRLRASASEIALDDLAAQLGASSASGHARVDRLDAKSRLALELAATRIDLAPFIGGRTAAPERDAAAAFVEALHALATGGDAEAKITVTDLTGAGVPVRDLRLDARVAQSALRAQTTATVSGMKLQGTLDYAVADAQRKLAMHVVSGQGSTGALPKGDRPANVSGTFGSVRGDLTATGDSTAALLAKTSGSLAARNLRIFWRTAARPVEVKLDAAQVRLAVGRASAADVRGRVGGEPCAVTVSGGALADLIDGARWPLRITGSCGAGRLMGSGYVTRHERGVDASLDFDARTPRIGALGAAFGLAAKTPLAFAARGRVLVAGERVQVDLADARLGATAGRGEAALSLDGKSPPRVQLALKNVNLNELALLAPGDAKPPPADVFDRAVLPANVALPDLDFDIAADSVRIGEDDLTRVGTRGAIRDGHLAETPIALTWQGVPLDGSGAIDLRGARPALAVRLEARDADLARVVARFKGGAMTLRAGRVGVRANATGPRIADLLASAAIELALEKFTAQRADRLMPWLDRQQAGAASLTVMPGRPTQVALNARIEDGTPVELKAEAGDLAALARAAFPVKVHGRLGEESIEVSGKFDRAGKSELRVRAQGKQLDRLGRLFAVTLPSTGPYDIGGTVRIGDDVLRVSDMDLRVGESRVSGALSATLGDRARYTASLRSPLVRLKDIGAEHWLDDGKETAGAPKQRPSEAELTRHTRDALHAFDAKVDFDIERFDAAGEQFVGGRIDATLDGGVLQARLDRSAASTGAFTAEMRVDARAAAPRIDVALRADGLEFGAFARSLDPTMTLDARIDLWLNLSAAGPPTQFLAKASGEIDLAVYPRDLPTGRLDLWGAGALQMLQTFVDSGESSRLNCAVASFDVEHGTARSRAFFADTTRTRIVGELEMNFDAQTIAGRLIPRSKAPELFAVAPSVALSGTIEAPKFGVSRESIVGVPLRFATPLVTYTRGWLTQTNPPRDGTPDCRKAFAQARRGQGAEAPPSAESK